jgi:hypothetical protein
MPWNLVVFCGEYRRGLEKIEAMRREVWDLCPTMSDIILPSLPAHSFEMSLEDFHEFPLFDRLAHSIVDHVVENNPELEYVYAYDEDAEFLTAEEEALDAYIDYMLDLDYDW